METKDNQKDLVTKKWHFSSKNAHQKQKRSPSRIEIAFSNKWKWRSFFEGFLLRRYGATERLDDKEAKETHSSKPHVEDIFKIHAVFLPVIIILCTVQWNNSKKNIFFGAVYKLW